jgi:biopolymer transport protein TolR
MAMALSGKGGGGRRRGRRATSQPIAEINVTPLVDVMLVLLIVFMVAAPLLTVGVPIDLPETKAPEMNTDAKPVTITVTLEGGLFLGEDPVTIETLIEQLSIVAPGGAEERILLKGDQDANYGAIMKVMGVLSDAGYKKIGLITAQEQVR